MITLNDIEMVDINEFTSTFGLVIVGMRKALNITQTELADMIGKDQSRISRIEKGARDTGIDLLYSISEALGIKFSEFSKQVEEISEHIISIKASYAGRNSFQDQTEMVKKIGEVFQEKNIPVEPKLIFASLDNVKSASRTAAV